MQPGSSEQSIAQVGAAVGMKVEDFYTQNRRGWVRLHKKGSKVTELPCHHKLDQFLEEWIAAAGLVGSPETPLLPTLRHSRLALSRRALPQANVHMIQRRAKDAGLRTKISAPSFRAAGITTYLKNGGKLEIAQAWPAMKARGQRASMTGAAMRWSSMKSSGSCSDEEDISIRRRRFEWYRPASTLRKGRG